MRSILVSFAVAALAVLQDARPAPNAAPTTVVLLVRHAEKAAEPRQDPPLTKAGAARARALAVVARDAGVTAIITTQFERTRKTAEPTATALHITPEVVEAGPAEHVKAVADQVLKHAGGTVLVVGHSNTIPAIVGALGAPRPRDLCDSEYDQLFVVVLGDTGPPRLIRSRYGAASAVDRACASMQMR